VADPAELTHVRLDAARLEAEVQSAIRELQPPTAREVVRLRLQEGRAYDAIAGEVGIPEGTAKIWVHRFRRRFGGSRPGAAE
jgi:DNA-directed RNA polymerase specialized sigma24 family protein